MAGFMGEHGPHARRWNARGLRWWVLSALAEGPKTGAEITHWIEAKSDGMWHPSPGSLYPLLGQLREEGVLRRDEEGRYELVFSTGPVFWKIASSPMNLDTAVRELEGYAFYIEDLSRATDISAYRERIEAVWKKLGLVLGKG